MNYLIIATQFRIGRTIEENERPSYDHTGKYRRTWDDVLAICNLYGVKPRNTRGPIIKQCSKKHAKFDLHSGEGCFRECNALLSSYMRSQKFAMYGYQFSAIPIESNTNDDTAEILTADVIASVPQFTYDLVVSPDHVHACMFAKLLPGVTVLHQICGTETRNAPREHVDKYRDVKQGDIIEFTHCVSYSTMSDGWEHHDPVTRYLLVTNRKTASMVYRELYDFDKETFNYSKMDDIDRTTKRLTKANVYQWDIFYNEYYWQDQYRIVDIINP